MKAPGDLTLGLRAQKGRLVYQRDLFTPLKNLLRVDPANLS